MTATRKVFLAAALVAAGFGIASLLGKPPAKSVPTSIALAVPRVLPAPPADHRLPGATVERPGQLRLIPDFSHSATASTALDAPLVEVAPPMAPRAKAIGIKAVAAEATQQTDSAAPWNAAPRARLRNEAPRAIALEWQPPTRIDPAPPPDVARAIAPSIEPMAAPPAWTTENTPTQYISASVAPEPQAPASTASYNEPAPSAPEIGPLAPPPWPAPADAGAPRTHIVVDGDSLARLAGRYLDDPRRGHEIYEANRGLLADPELLPIGAELVIPGRSSHASSGPDSPRSLAPRTVAIHAPAGGGLVPVRPLPPSAAVVPQAKLTRPLPVE